MQSTTNDNYFMQQAFVEARKAFDAGEVPVGAVIVCEGRIIARGFNQTERLNDVTAHAEIIAPSSGNSRRPRNSTPPISRRF